jgi:hemolysin activation/secretion protein
VVVRAIIVNGARDIPRKEMDAALSTFVGHRLTQDDMQDLLSTLSGLARARGYVFARSSIPAQTLDSGVLHVDLDEGRVDEVRLTGQANKAVLAILDGLCGYAPRQQEVDRLLTLAQDVPGVRLGQARYEREGDRGILIVPLVNDRGAGHLAVDNWGTGALGPARVQLGYDFNGLIDDKDALSLSVMVTPAQPRELHSFWGRYARQIGHGGTEVAIYGGFGATNSGGAWRAYDANGRWVTAGLSVAQPLLRGRKVSLWLNASLDYIAVNQWFSDAMVRRDRVTTASLSLNGYMPLAGGRLRAGAGVVQGLDVLGATQAGIHWPRVLKPMASSPASTPGATGLAPWSARSARGWLSPPSFRQRLCWRSNRSRSVVLLLAAPMNLPSVPVTGGSWDRLNCKPASGIARMA